MPNAPLRSIAAPITSRAKRWDIFCTVIDNYGDIGVCWRLARQLANEYDFAVRLWVDDLASFARICPKIDPTRDQQSVAKITVMRWTAAFFTEHVANKDFNVADVIIEAFACELPPSYINAMVQWQENQRAMPRWINLEYLSAEAWVADCHGLPSPHPNFPLVKYFFIPGFDRHSAGLLRERDLIAQHAHFTQSERSDWWTAYGGEPAEESLKISLFAYENTSVSELIENWRQGPQAVCCLVTDSRVLSSVKVAVGSTLIPGKLHNLQFLQLRTLTFMPQEAYDRLLAACDINFVRGEDSLVRAIWAGKPFIWHIYPQDDNAHQVKLNAFLDRYCLDLSPAAAVALRDFWHAWNNESVTKKYWQAYANNLPEIAVHTESFRDQLLQLPDLAKTLAEFCQTQV